MTRRTRKAAVVAIGALLAGLLVALAAFGVTEDDGAGDRLRRSKVAFEPAEWVHGRRVYRSGVERLGQLRAPLFAPLLGDDAALAVTSPTRGAIVYHAWDGAAPGPGVPVLRIYSSEGGPERVLAHGGQSVAWRRDGALAYMRAKSARYAPTPAGTFGGRYGQVVVHASSDARAVPWTSEQPRQYVVRAWAGSTLVVEVRPSHLTRDRRPSGVYALDGPGRLRALPIRDFIAVSPDGLRIVGAFGQGDGPATSVRVVAAASGRIEASLALPFVDGPGDWRGQTLVAPRLAGRRSELVVLRVAGDKVDQVGRLAVTSARRLGGRFGPFLSRPVFVRANRIVVRVAAADADETYVFTGFFRCDVPARRCTRGRNLMPATTWAALIENPSRPEPAPS